MSTENHKSLIHSSPAKESGVSRIIFDNNLSRWFSRNLGLWRSRRQYFFDSDDALNVDMLIRVEKFVEKKPGDLRYKISWSPENEGNFFSIKPDLSKEGSIQVSIFGHQLYRTNGYFNESESISSIKQVDENEMIFESQYNNWYVLEYCRLIDLDNYRSRSIYTWENDKLKIVENHHEIKIESTKMLISD